MAKKCLPGVICIENVTLVSIFIILIVLLSVWYFMNQKEIDNSSNILKEKQSLVNSNTSKIEDYNQLNNSMTTTNVIWVILLIIFIVGAMALGYLYFLSEEN